MLTFVAQNHARQMEFPENLSENITVIMIAAKNMVRHWELLENFTKIMISFLISRIA
ncbi:hypothetical protein N9357_04190 [bacterium]|nr:hypothetical protein [bacterium]